jgi:hypothetical protein
MDVRVPWRDPRSATVDARVASAEVVSGNIAAAATRPFTAGWREGRAHVEGLEAEGAGLQVRASGSAGVRPDDPIDARIQVAGDLASLGSPRPWSVGGTFAADVTLAGARLTPRIVGAIDALDVPVSGADEARSRFSAWVEPRATASPWRTSRRTWPAVP